MGVLSRCCLFCQLGPLQVLSHIYVLLFSSSLFLHPPAPAYLREGGGCLAILSWLALNFGWFPCFHCLNARTTGMRHYTWLSVLYSACGYTGERPISTGPEKHFSSSTLRICQSQEGF